MPHGLNLGMRDETSTGSCWCDSYQKKSGAVPGSQGLVFRSHILHTFWRWRRFIKKHWHRWLPPPQICTHCRSRQNWIQLRYDIYIYISTVVYTQVLVYRSNIAARQCIGVYHVYIYPELSNQAGHVDLQRWWNHLSRCRLVSAMWFLSCVLRWYLNTIERVRHKNDTIYIYIYVASISPHVSQV